MAITSTPETVLHHGFGGLLYSRHSSITFSASPIPKPPAVRPTFRSTEKHHSYAVYKLTYRLGYSIIILIRVCLKSDRRKITDTKSCKRKDDTVDIRRFIFLYFFMALCFIAYFICRKTVYRNWVLIVFSMIFYAWGEPVWVFLLIGSVTVNYVGGLLIDKFRDTKKLQQ